MSDASRVRQPSARARATSALTAPTSAISCRDTPASSCFARSSTRPNRQYVRGRSGEIRQPGGDHSRGAGLCGRTVWPWPRSRPATMSSIVRRPTETTLRIAEPHRLDQGLVGHWNSGPNRGRFELAVPQAGCDLQPVQLSHPARGGCGISDSDVPHSRSFLPHSVRPARAARTVDRRSRPTTFPAAPMGDRQDDDGAPLDRWPRNNQSGSVPIGPMAVAPAARWPACLVPCAITTGSIHPPPVGGEAATISGSGAPARSSSAVDPAPRRRSPAVRSSAVGPRPPEVRMSQPLVDQRPQRPPQILGRSRRRPPARRRSRSVVTARRARRPFRSKTRPVRTSVAVTMMPCPLTHAVIVAALRVGCVGATVAIRFENSASAANAGLDGGCTPGRDAAAVASSRGSRLRAGVRA